MTSTRARIKITEGAMLLWIFNPMPRLEVQVHQHTQYRLTYARLITPGYDGIWRYIEDAAGHYQRTTGCSGKKLDHILEVLSEFPV